MESEIENSEQYDRTVIDVNDNLYELNVLGSNQFDTKTFACCQLPDDQTFNKCDCSNFTKAGFDMKTEQMKDENLTKIRSMLLNGEGNKDVETHYLLVDELIYYIYNVNDDLV